MSARRKPEVTTTLGARVRELREQRGWSWEELAAAAHVSFPTIKRVERGKYPRVDHLIAIADCLQVSLDDIVGRTAPPARQESAADKPAHAPP